MNYLKISKEIYNAVKSIAKKRKFKYFALHEPEIGSDEIKFTKDCLKTGWVSTNGEFISKFENELKKVIKIKNILLLNSGTSALHIALKSIEIKENDEVLVPTLTFVATVNAIKYCNAIPHFVDSELNTLGVDAEQLIKYLKKNTKQTSKGLKNINTNNYIRALIVTHVYGTPSNMDQLVKLTKKFGIHLIEDAAEGLGSYYKKKHVGNFGIISVLSFNGNKIITTGAGGAILTNNKKVFEKAKHLSNVAKDIKRTDFFHDKVGYNYRMPNINAAIGCAQIKKLRSFLKRKKLLNKFYKNYFNKIKNIDFFEGPHNNKSNNWLNIIFLKNNSINLRNKILLDLEKKKIYCRPIWFPINKLPMYKKCPSMKLKNIEFINKNLICLPSSPILFSEK
tara:strand:+ start:7377 stop:8558 length:1182 start_codon:yes stop_codon:yes gene_type:complete